MDEILKIKLRSTVENKQQLSTICTSIQLSILHCMKNLTEGQFSFLHTQRTAFR